MNSPSTLLRVRRLVLLTLVLGLIGTGAELLLVGHTEDPLQWAPLVMIVGCLAVLAWDVLSGSAGCIRVLKGMMAMFLLGGGIGLAVHWQSKIEFKREMDPSLGGPRLFWEAMKSQSPPALAPGVFLLLALLGHVYTTLRSTK